MRVTVNLRPAWSTKQRGKKVLISLYQTYLCYKIRTSEAKWHIQTTRLTHRTYFKKKGHQKVIMTLCPSQYNSFIKSIEWTIVFNLA